MLQSYIPVLVFAGLGILIGGVFTMLNHYLGPKRPSRVKSEAYECGLPSEVKRDFRFGVSFYLVAMAFILFDIEVIFLLPVSIVLSSAESVFALGAVGLFVFLIMLALVYDWRKGALDWK